MKLITKHILEITAFVSGSSVMVVELTAARILAPYVGTSFFVWTNIIGVILASLSLGYYLGGKISKKPSLKTLSKILLFVGILILIIAASHRQVLSVISSLTFFNIIIISFISTVALFAIPGILFGLISPYLARLKIKSVQDSGKTVGTLYAISTIGSIAGTFLTGFFLISVLGSTHILILVSFVLIINSLLLSFTIKFKGGKAVGILILVLCSLLFLGSSKASEIETQYSTVEIYDQKDSGKDARFMIINGLTSSAVYLKDDELVFPYFHYYNLVNHFNPGFKDTLMIGGAGYAYPTYLIKHNSKATIDVVEIDPELTLLAKEHFGLSENARLKAIHEDGRIFLNRNLTKYDAIFIDAFSTYSVPHHLVTIEAATKMNEALNENGVVISNVVSAVTGEKGRAIQAIYKTFKEVFPHVYVFLVSDATRGAATQNIMLVALKSDAPTPFISNDEYLNDKLKHVWNEKIENEVAILTDDYSPIEQYMLGVYKDLPARER